MDKVVKIDGKEVGFRATALTPRLYRHKIGRDIVQDISKLKRAFDKAVKAKENPTEEDLEDAQLSVMDLEIFENVAYIMAKQYDSSIPGTTDEWLDGFATFSIYEILPSILELWQFNNLTTAKPKKK
ncbi:hypothetical protein WGC32_14215 [Zongyangia sp. HA2173]|uniref:hypothetical protein n=1 Tax=Zongyangia sp. HA2173 TaxID=3133035 RepID=UPI00316580BE